MCETGKNVAVVGGGLSGLSAAHELLQRGHDVRVFEAQETLGGLAATYETAGDPIERFYHHLLASETTILETIEDLGLGDDVEWRIGKTAFYRDGEVHPLDTPLDVLRYPYLGLRDKLLLGILTFGADATGAVPRPGAFDEVETYDDVPLEDFILEHTTEAVYEEFFLPLIDAKFGDRKGGVSAAWLLGRIKFRNNRDPLRGEVLGYLEGGFDRLVRTLVESVGRENIETGAPVTALHHDGDGVRSVEVDHGVGATETWEADTAVVATMPHVLEDLTGYICEVDFQGTVCTVVSIDEPVTDTYWLNLADEAPFGVFIEHTNFVPPERYGGEHLLYLASYIQSPQNRLWKMGDEQVEDLWLDAVDDMFPAFNRGDVNWVRTSRNPRTAPVYEQGYLDLVVPYDLSDEVAPGVYYSGMATRAQYPDRSLSGAIEAGKQAAARVADGSHRS